MKINGRGLDKYPPTVDDLDKSSSPFINRIFHHVTKNFITVVFDNKLTDDRLENSFSSLSIVSIV